MRLRHWYAQRGPDYILQRAAVLLNRYGVTPDKAIERVMDSVTLLAENGCAPTFPTPGRVVARYPRYFRALQERGAEIAVHAFDHVDLSTYPPEQGSKQLKRAADTFDRQGIERHGFRCPYLGCTDDLLDALPEGLFSYSSNQAIAWDTDLPEFDGKGNRAMREVLERVYKPLQARDAICVPWSRSHLVEIPVALPDDLTLHDGLQLGPQGLAEAWSQVLRATHSRGELFVLIFHPELADRCQDAFARLLTEAAQMTPGVWVARLSDIGQWWRQKAAFSVEVTGDETGLHLSFSCSDRATILVRGVAMDGSEPQWDGKYQQLQVRVLQTPADPRPFLGLPGDTAVDTVNFLREQGYLLDLTESAPRCATYLEPARLSGLTSQVELVNFIEGTTGPLIRYWRWPDGAKSCLSVTGDLDALTLLDYAARLFVR